MAFGHLLTKRQNTEMRMMRAQRGLASLINEPSTAAIIAIAKQGSFVVLLRFAQTGSISSPYDVFFNPYERSSYAGFPHALDNGVLNGKWRTPTGLFRGLRLAVYGDAKHPHSGNS